MPNILFEELHAVNGKLGLITLNRPEALNALDYDMLQQMQEYLSRWQQQSNIKAVVIRSTSAKAFCAGGDIRKMYQRFIAGEKIADLFQYFKLEYSVNSQIYHFPKPYIALINGIAMGGGLGISVHGSYRVADSSLVMAMPETRIGYFPDVGASYFLSRCPDSVGMYLGLTGARLDIADAHYCGLVNYPVNALDSSSLIAQMQQADWLQNAYELTHKILSQQQSNITKNELKKHQTQIDYYFSAPTLADIFKKLKMAHDSWPQQQLTILERMSPTSLAVTFEEIKRGKNLDFDQCMAMEEKLSYAFLHHRDFFEGVRAAIIDKDQQPKWQPYQNNLTDFFE